jgi:probable HAF family extracellular repeat protein
MRQGNRSFAGAVFAVAAIIGAAAAARGDGFTTIDVPGARDTKLWGINSNGDVVGYYTEGVGLPFHGFLQISDGSVQTIDVPFAEATYTAARAINDNGDIVGRYGLADGNERGWLLHNGLFTVIAVPGATSTTALGINNLGAIVGAYNVGPIPHGYVLTGGCFTTIDIPDAILTNVRGINDVGDIVGRYDTADHILHGYVLTADGHFQALDFPTATMETVAGAINAKGEIVGRTVTASGTHGFLFKHGRFRQIDFPGATTTEAAGIADDIVGSYDFGGPPPPVQHGFRRRE